MDLHKSFAMFLNLQHLCNTIIYRYQSLLSGNKLQIHVWTILVSNPLLLQSSSIKNQSIVHTLIKTPSSSVKTLSRQHSSKLNNISNLMAFQSLNKGVIKNCKTEIFFVENTIKRSTMIEIRRMRLWVETGERWKIRLQKPTRRYRV